MRAVHLGRWLPGVEVARRYERSWLRHDLIAGVVVTALLIPAGIGYAEAAGLPAATGLYATIVPLLAYALVGPVAHPRARARLRRWRRSSRRRCCRWLRATPSGPSRWPGCWR